MPVEAACPSCEGKFRLPDAAAGKKIRCPKCKGPLEVPPLGAEVPPAPAVAPTPAVTPPARTKVPSPALALNENLKTAWRSASQEPAPVESPRVELPKVQPPTPVVPSKPTATLSSPKLSPATIESPKKTVSPPTPAFVPPTPFPTTPTPKPKPPEPTPAAVPKAPAEQWFLKGEDGETFGPVDRATLDSWHDEGRMTADSQLLKHGTEQWQWASDVYPDLEEPEPEPETPPAAPATTSSIHQSAATTAEQESVSRKSKFSRTVATVDDEDDPEETGLSPHSKPIAVLLGLTLGMFGIHRFYLGYVGIGLAMFFTFGGLLMWSITDSLRILFGHVTDSEGLKLRD
jgi:hypothetical protein